MAFGELATQQALADAARIASHSDPLWLAKLLIETRQLAKDSRKPMTLSVNRKDRPGKCTNEAQAAAQVQVYLSLKDVRRIRMGL